MALADETVKRASQVGRLLVNEGMTIREIAEFLSVSKTTVHRDVTERLPRVDPTLAGQARTVLNKHIEERHVLGGEAIKKKFNHGEAD
jgi:putative DeoR family transcriptional regulator (stage III sporulation protein D)